MDLPGIRGIPEDVYCALDKIDLAAKVDERQVAIQTDHRSREDIERELELSVLCAMARVVNARQSGAGPVFYVVGEPPPLLAEALRAAGATISDPTTWERVPRLPASPVPDNSEELVGELADRCFRELALRVAATLGTRDLAIALRMLEDQTLAAPPDASDPTEYWPRILELAALTGELLRTKASTLGASGRWAQTDRALVPFGFELTTAAGTTVLFPTNRAQRLLDDGADESLFKLLVALEETLQRPDVAAGRLMPSLRDRRNVEIDEVIWQPLLPEAERVELPIVVCGIDGESTFGMIRKEALARPPDAALEEALANLAREEIEVGELTGSDLRMLAVAGSFYAAEKILDRALLRRLHDHLAAPALYAGVPSRGVLLLAPGDPAIRARFAAVVRTRFDEAGGRQIAPVVLVIEDGAITGFVRDTAEVREDTGQIRADTLPDRPEDPSGSPKPGILRRLFGRKP